MSSIRKLENFHILLWLLKDTAWLLTWRALGIFMIIPAVGFAILITWRSRHSRSELMHNLAIVCWICANSFWMICEFYLLPESTKILAIIPFAIGISFIATYYFQEFCKIKK